VPSLLMPGTLGAQIWAREKLPVVRRPLPAVQGGQEAAPTDCPIPPLTTRHQTLATGFRQGKVLCSGIIRGFLPAPESVFKPSVR